MDNPVNIRRQRVVGVVLSYLTLGLNTFISIVYTPYMLRCLGQSQYGLYQLIGSLANYLSLLSMGLTGAYIRFHAIRRRDETGKELEKLNGMYIIAFSLMAFAAIIIGMIMTVNLSAFFDRSMTEQELLIGKIMMFLMTINATITLPRTIFTSYISANERFIFQRMLTLLYGIFYPLICVIALYYGGNAVTITIIAVCCTIWLFVCEVWYSIRNLKFKFTFRGIQKSDFKSIFFFSSFILINDITNQINWSVDKVILGVFSGTVAVAVYGIASQLNTYYLSISTTISSVYAPEVNRIEASNLTRSQKDDEHTNIFMRVGRTQSFIIFLVITGYIFFGKDFIRLWAGPGYTESYYIGLWLMIPVSIPLLQNIGIEIQRAKNMHKTRTIVYAIVAVGNIFLSIPLCQLYGAVGCAIGTAISLTAGNILFMNWYYHKRMHIDIRVFWKAILYIIPALILPSLLGIWMCNNIIIDNFFQLALNLLVYTITYVISLYFWGMNQQDRVRCKSIFRKVYNSIMRCKK